MPDAAALSGINCDYCSQLVKNTAMEKIYLSDAGPKVSPAIYGFYRWDDEHAAPGTMEKIVNLCLELGINTFDHADIYGSFQCEELFGDLLRQKSLKREDVVLFTKCGLKV